MLRVLSWLIAVPLALAMMAFAVANRGAVSVAFDPLPFAFHLPLYAALLAMFLAGLTIGAGAAWLVGARWRRLARRRRRAIHALEREVSSLKERPAVPVAGPPVPAPAGRP